RSAIPPGEASRHQDHRAGGRRRSRVSEDCHERLHVVPASRTERGSLAGCQRARLPHAGAVTRADDSAARRFAASGRLRVRWPMSTRRNLRIKGDLTAAEDLTVDFAIDGSVDLPGNRLGRAEDARLNATVTAASVTVRGHLDGHIVADRLELTSSAVVSAGVVVTRLTLHDGAQFTGPVHTEQAKAAGTVARHRQKTVPSTSA